MFKESQSKNIESLIRMVQSGQVNLTNDAHVLMHEGQPIAYTVIGLLLKECNLAPSYVATKMINRGQVDEFPLYWLNEIETRFGLSKSTLQKLERVNDFSKDSERKNSVCVALERISASQGSAEFDPGSLLIELNAADFDC